MKYTKELYNAARMYPNGQMEQQVNALLDELDRLQQASRWIPTSERKPTVDDCRRDSEGNLIPFVMGCINGTLYRLIPIHHFALNDYYTDWQPIQPLPTPPEGE